MVVDLMDGWMDGLVRNRGLGILGGRNETCDFGVVDTVSLGTGDYP